MNVCRHPSQEPLVEYCRSSSRLVDLGVKVLIFIESALQFTYARKEFGLLPPDGPAGPAYHANKENVHDQRREPDNDPAL